MFSSLFFRCGLAKSEADFGAAAWKARNAERRCCRTCTTKMRDHWTCSHCAERKPRAEFSAWQEKRARLREMARNVATRACLWCWCVVLPHERINACCVCGSASSRSASKRFIEEVRREIAKKTNSTLQSKPYVTQLPGKTRNPAGVGNSREEAASAEGGADAGKESHEHRGSDRNKDSTFHYICPFCDVAISSSVRSGMVNHRNQCGHQFRVHDGRVTAKKLAYRCPFCNGIVASRLGRSTIGACVATGFTSKAARSARGCDNMRTNARSAKLWCGQHAPRGEFASGTRHRRGASAHGAAGTVKKRNQHRTVKTVGVTTATAEQQDVAFGSN